MQNARETLENFDRKPESKIRLGKTRLEMTGK